MKWTSHPITPHVERFQKDRIKRVIVRANGPLKAKRKSAYHLSRLKLKRKQLKSGFLQEQKQTCMKQKGDTTIRAQDRIRLQTVLEQKPLNLPKQLYSHPNHNQKTELSKQPPTSMDESDEQFIAQFAALNSSPEPFSLPQNIVNTRDWTLIVLAVVITDRNVMEANFKRMMARVWGVHHDTEITMIAKNTFLLQLVTENDTLHILHRGLWTYREDAIATKRAYGPEDLKSPKVDRIELTTQWHRIPLETVKKEGVRLLAEEMGTPLSEVTEVCNAGTKFYKIKLLLPLDKPLSDKREVAHLVLGTFTAYIVYERECVCFVRNWDMIWIHV